MVAAYVSGPDDLSLDDMILAALREHEVDVRADERRKVLAEVETAVRLQAAKWIDQGEAEALIVGSSVAIDSLRAGTKGEDQ